MGLEGYLNIINHLTTSLSWLESKFEYRYYQFLLHKYYCHHYVKALSNRTKVMVSSSVFALLLTIGWFSWKEWEKNEESIRNKSLADFCDKRKLSSRRKKGFPPGLYNEGNTCFANCVLQALSSSSQFVSWVNAVFAHGDVSEITLFPSIYRLFQVLTNTSGNERYYSSSEVITSLISHGWVISSEQQDAYEFYQLINTTLDEELLKAFNIKTGIPHEIGEPHKVTPTILNKVGKELPLLFSREYNTSPLKGLLANKMICMTCGNQTPVKFESFESIMLSLEVMSLTGISIRTCLDKWIRKEVVHNVECIKCNQENGRKAYTSFTKQLLIAKLPVCLCIQLQRTYYTPSGMCLKNPVYVKFEEFLNLTEYTYHYVTYKEQLKPSTHNKRNLRLLGGSIQQNADVPQLSRSSIPFGMYKLSSVIVHFGGANQGHFATCRRLPEDPTKWVYVSDQLVKIVSKAEVFVATAYLLFYERIN